MLGHRLTDPSGAGHWLRTRPIGFVRHQRVERGRQGLVGCRIDNETIPGCFMEKGSPWGVGGARPRVVAFSCVFNSDVLPRGLKRSPGSRGLKKSPLGKSWSGRVRPDARSRRMLDASPFPFSMPNSEGVGSCKSPRIYSSPTANALTRYL